MHNLRRLEALDRGGEVLLRRDNVNIDFNRISNGQEFIDFCDAACRLPNTFTVEIMYKHRTKPLWVVTDKYPIRGTQEKCPTLKEA